MPPMHAAQSISERFFDPAGQMWKINRETVLLLAGGRALLMQLAHPKVAAGVAQHSGFERDPLARLHRTMSSMWSIIFDDGARARAVLGQIEAVHKRVRGVVPVGEKPHGNAVYSALDQDLLLWVHATLIDSAMAAYSLFVAPLTAAERQGYYDDSRKLARLFGIEERRIPATVDSFEKYLAEIMKSGEITAGPTARRLAHSILYPRPLVLRPAGPLFRLLTAGLLPEPLRGGYEFEWNERRMKCYLLAGRAIRVLRPAIPAPLRVVPNARRAERPLRKASVLT
jgi:uncharacterized protein (DUF2236 family)